jgi:hypothetical protein
VYCNGPDTCADGVCSRHAGDPCAGGGECRDACDEPTRGCAAPAGTRCADEGDLCTADLCDGAGGCTHLVAPYPTCTAPARSGRTRLELVRGRQPEDDELSWTLDRAGATERAELGDPLTTTGYALCVFDGAGSLLLDARVAPGGRCGRSPCWTIKRNRVRYHDPTGATAGIVRLAVKAARAGRADASAVGRGAALGLPVLPIAHLPLTVQLHNTEGACWGATYAGASRNTSSRFIAKGGPQP